MTTTAGRRVFDEVLAVLEGAGIDADVRKEVAGRELDLSVAAHDLGRLDVALPAAGFARFHARGQRGHRFYLTCIEGAWLKVDAKPRDAARPALLSAGASILPLGLRRTGPVVAFVGPDGAGKGTLISVMRETIPVAVTVHYLGSRAGGGSTSRGIRRRLPLTVREPLFVVKKLARAAGKLAIAYAYAWRGAIVLCDRHPVEALATRPRQTRVAAALERLLLQRVLPSPDLILVLDAPTEVLLARKPEHEAAVIDAWRAGYRAAFAGDPRAYLCSTDAPLEDVADDLRTRIWTTVVRRRRVVS